MLPVFTLTMKTVADDDQLLILIIIANFLFTIIVTFSFDQAWPGAPQRSSWNPPSARSSCLPACGSNQYKSKPVQIQAKVQISIFIPKLPPACQAYPATSLHRNLSKLSVVFVFSQNYLNLCFCRPENWCRITGGAKEARSKFFHPWKLKVERSFNLIEWEAWWW